MKIIGKHFWHLSILVLAFGSAVDALGDEAIYIDGPGGRIVINNPQDGQVVNLPNGQSYVVRRGATGLTVERSAASPGILSPSSTVASSTVPSSTGAGATSLDVDVCKQYMFTSQNRYRVCMDGKARALEALKAQFADAGTGDHPCRDSNMVPGPERAACAQAWRALRDSVVATANAAPAVECFNTPSVDTVGNPINYQTCAAGAGANPFYQNIYGDGSQSPIANNFRSFLGSF